jgi:hypothetical protein
MEVEQLKPNVVVRGPIFSEPVQVIVVAPMGPGLFKLIGKGMATGSVHEPVLTREQLASLTATPEREPFDGDPERFRLGIEALRLGLAYEYDPYFSLSIARIDPLPHQLEAVYEYFLASPRIRFLLADDPGAGKTIMAGLLLKELKIRGLVQRTLIVTPANLTFQWQRELKDKFRENFEVIRSDVLRANYGLNPGSRGWRMPRRACFGATGTSAFVEWSTKSVRDAFFASPQFPRLTNPDAIRDTIVRGVEEERIAYVGRDGPDNYEPFYFGERIDPQEV